MDTEDVPQVLSSSTLTEETVEAVEDKEVESKESCHDSGIDIRETSIPPIQPVQNKKVSLIYVICAINFVC